MLMAIVDRGNARALSRAMMEGGFTVTKISTSGGFLQSGSTTLVSVVNNEHVERALEIIRSAVKAVRYKSGSLTEEGRDAIVSASRDYPSEILMSGATVFVLNVEERFSF